MTHSKYSCMVIFTGHDELTIIQFVITPGEIGEIRSLLKAGINALTDEGDCVRQVLVHAESNLDEYLDDKLDLGTASTLAYDDTNRLMQEIRIYVKNDYVDVDDKSEIYAEFDGSSFE